MRFSTLLFALLALHIQLQAQTIQEIATGAGYQKQSFVNLTAGTEKQVANTAWDIAFTVYGLQDGGVFINESAGTVMGQPQAVIELYDALTNNFADQPDPAALTANRLFNSEKSWSYGAFNEVRDPSSQLDYGWGQYNFMNHSIAGSKVYVLKLRNGQYRKIKIELLSGNIYTFRYANLDGAGETVKTINKTEHAGKTLAYFNFETGATADVEPATDGFDLMYCRYYTPLYDSTNMTVIPYQVTGILHGRGATVAEAAGIDPETVQFANYQGNLKSELDAIGYDWKTFTGSAWSIDLNRVYFLKTAQNRVWKLYFLDFEGSSTGKAVFEKTDLGIVSAVQSPLAVGLKALAYPNPVESQLTLSLDVPAALAQSGLLEVVDVQGRIVGSRPVELHTGFQVFEMPANNWPSGFYVLRLRLSEQEINLGKIIKR